MNTLHSAVDALHLAVDPAFALDIHGALNGPQNVSADALLRSLVARIQNDPLDLHAHTLRILTLIDLEEPETLFAALIDLFLATGNKAAALRSALLDAAALQLPAEENTYLRQRLEHGLSARQLLPNTRGSCLTPGLIGTSTLVHQQTLAAGSEDLDSGGPLTMAIRLLEEGQLDEARAMLEKAWIADPGNDEIALELFEIHRRLRDPHALVPLKEQLAAVGGKLPPSWASLDSTS